VIAQLLWVVPMAGFIAAGRGEPRHQLRAAAGATHVPTFYRIRVNRQLSADWTQWFGGLALAEATHGQTTITGSLADQAALHGVLAKNRDLGLELVSVERGLDTPADTAQDAAPDRAQEDPAESCLASDGGAPPPKEE
jgi:hypothetical protein